MRKVALLGSTGSVGTQALAAVRSHPEQFRVTALAAGSQSAALEAQVREFRPEAALLAHPPKGYRPPDVRGVTWLLGEPAERAISGCDTVLNAIVGAQGLPASLAAARAGLRLCLANKESLVAGGALLMREIRRGGATLLPVDSEHSAVFQCLAGCSSPPEKIILTASGGPFRTLPLERMRTATPAQALRHPTWSMGERISIDSATMVNKALEIIEAGWLFGMRADDIDVLIHPQSVIHSMVRHRDGSVIAQMGVPDMRIPILYALSYPERLPSGAKALDLASYGELTFEAPDEARFPALGLGRQALKAGGVAGAMLNAADEEAVSAYLAGRCGFLDIASLCEGAMEAAAPVSSPTYEDIQEADGLARRWVRERLSIKS